MPESIHETDFCAKVASWADQFFATSDVPFGSSGIEGFGTGDQRRKRKDLRFYDRTKGRIALCGEVKLPGTIEGRSPYDQKLVEDAHKKADNANVQYFFTWNVNSFVLWDRSRWDVPLLDRRVREWPLGRFLRSSEDVARPENLDFIRTRFLPNLLLDLARIYRGQQPDWPMPPDDVFIRSLESHLSWPIDITRNYLAAKAESSPVFDKRLQGWLTDQDWIFRRRDAEEWGEVLDRAAQTLVHVLANRLIFYQSLRARFADLPRLQLRRVNSPADAYASFQRLFGRAVTRTGDYEPLFYPYEQDWAGRLAFEGPGALDAWRATLRGIESYDFSHISSDVVGKVFQRLVSPEERHRWGQHFTGDDVVDLINTFCIRTADGAVLDPACGSGSFLVRAYYLKRTLRPQKSHLELLSELFGCDIALYPAHLATLNLAAREINDEANYPRIARKDFFDVVPNRAFCTIPPSNTEVPLPELSTVVGNPPYLRQEKIEDKRHQADVVASRWHGLRLSGRSDTHCYFWPAAAALLKEGGYFGFLTSSSWLDVEYGFALQRWILQNFRLVAVMESAAEPWFPDARVKTCVTILQRCSGQEARDATLAKFVQFKRSLAEIIGVPPDQHETRFRSLRLLRDFIESSQSDVENEDVRIIVKAQAALWQEGVRAHAVLARDGAAADRADDEDEDGTSDGSVAVEEDGGQLTTVSEYAAGKWGRYVRAPDFYFEVMREFGPRFVPLGEIVDIRFGVKSGCDAFFMPHDITRAALERAPAEREFKRENGVERRLVESGEIKMVRAGDGSVHPIEATFLKPEVHTLRNFQRPVFRSSDCDRVILLVGEALERLKGTWVARYLRYGETRPFTSGKSKAVPVPKRSTCAARNLWYDLTKSARPGFAFWPMAHQYRHVIPYNPESLICNHRMFDIGRSNKREIEPLTLTAILNSTVVALFKTFYGRFTGTEGSLDTEVIDVEMLEVPDASRPPSEAAERILRAFASLRERNIGFLVEEELSGVHSPERAQAIARQPLQLSQELRQEDRRTLDDAVFELLGESDRARRNALVNRLYEETARHFRQIRVVEIQKMEQRAKTAVRRFTAEDLAADAWDAIYLKDSPPIVRVLSSQTGPKVLVAVPAEGAPRLVDENSMFDREVVFFGTGRKAGRVVCASRAQAELVGRLASLGVREDVAVPAGEAPCRELLATIETQLETARNEFKILASSRTSNEKLRDEIVDLMMHWMVHGRPRVSSLSAAPAESLEATTS